MTPDDLFGCFLIGLLALTCAKLLTAPDLRRK